MKRMGFMTWMIILLLLLSSCARSATADSNTLQPNPIHTSTAEEILDQLGIMMHVPSNAKDITYAILELIGETSMAQAQFTSNGIACTYRIQSASKFTDISGAYFEWKTIKPVEISYCSGEIRIIEGQQGICLWYDTVPGLMYSVYIESGASEETLTTLANELYVPAKDVP